MWGESRHNWKRSVYFLHVFVGKMATFPQILSRGIKDSTQCPFGLRMVPCWLYTVIGIRSQHVSISVFVIIWRGIWNSRVFIFGFRQWNVLLLPGCLQSQQDCVVRPLGGRQRYCASSDINPADSLCRMVQKVQTERAENSPYLCLTRSLLWSVVRWQ